MTDVEEQLRRDLRQGAERIAPGSVRPLRHSERRRAPGLVRWLAPVTAVAAVLGVIVGVYLVTTPGSAVPGAVAAGPGPMPPYYVTVLQAHAGTGSQVATTAVVHDSATGATLARVPVPTLINDHGGTFPPSITAAADDRTFVITEYAQDPWATAEVSPGSPTCRFYLLSVASDGRSATLRLLTFSLPEPLAINFNFGYTNMVALSPDGTRLAVSACSNANHCVSPWIRVITLATGRVRDWTTRVPGAAAWLSWVGDDHLAFDWQGTAGPKPSYKLLNVAGRGGNLLAAPNIWTPGFAAVQPAMITQDGKGLITNAIQTLPQSGRHHRVINEIVELSASTGQPLQVLYSTTASTASSPCTVLFLAPEGVQPLVACPRFGRLENGKLTPLPGFPSAQSTGPAGQSAVAW